MGQVTPNIGIYIPAAGETNYDSSFAAGMVNIDQHDHSGGPNKGVPIATAGIADGSITYNKLNANVADNTTGIGTAGGGLANQLIILGLLKNIYQIATTNGFLVKNGSSAAARTITGTANQIAVTNGDGTTSDPVLSLTNPIRIGGVSFDAGAHTLQNYVDSGTWTPGIAFGGAATGITYSAQNGFYTRIGNIVFYTFNLALTSKGSATGNCTITGFPITMGANSITINPVNSSFDLDPDYTELTSRVVVSTTTMSLEEVRTQTNGGTASLTDAYFSNTSTLRGSGFYIIQ